MAFSPLQMDNSLKLLHIPSQMFLENKWLLRSLMGTLTSLREGKLKSNRLNQCLMLVVNSNNNLLRCRMSLRRLFLLSFPEGGMG